jgi:WD40 repeat protein
VVTYNAFMSYSHAADGMLAPALQSALHRFAKPWYRLRALHIFRDKTTLAVTPSLWGAIQAALDESTFFILLASPESAASVWVQQEIEYWLKRNPPQRMLIVLTSGELQWDRASGGFNAPTTTALPEMLMRRFADEPLYLDLRWAHDETHLSLSHPRFRDAVADLAATLHGRPKDELVGEDVLQHRRALRIAWSAAATLAVLAFVSVIAALVAFQQRNIAEVQRSIAVEQSQTALARQLAAQSASVRVQFPDRLPLAVLLASESTRLHPSFEGNEALRAALTLLPRPVQSYAYDFDPGGQGRVRALAFSPDGKALAVARDAGTADLFELNKSSVARTLQPSENPAAVLDLTAGHGENSSEASAESSSDDNSENSTEMTALAFSPDGRIVATASNDGTARLWETATGRELLTVQHGSHVVSVTFSPDGTRLATGSADGKLRLFTVATNPADIRKMLELRMEFQHGEEVRQVMFSPDGHLLAAISTDGGISLTTLDTKASRRVWSAGAAGLGLAFSPDGKRLATANGSFAFVWDVATGRELFKAMHATSAYDAESPMRWIDSVALSPDGNYLASAARDGTARVWNLTTRQELIRLTHAAPVEAVAFSRDGTTLTTGSFDGTARLWELPSGRERLRATHAGGSEVVAFSPDGGQVASGGSEGSVNIWSLSRGDQLAATTHPDAVSAVSLNPSGDRVATADDRGGLRIWRTNGQIERTLDAPARASIIFSEDGRYLAGATSSSLFTVDLANDDTLKALAGSRDARDFLLSPRYVVGEASDRQHIRVWATAGGRELPPIEASHVQSFRLDPTGCCAVIEELDEYGKKGAIRIRDLSAREDLRRTPIDGNKPDEFALGPHGRMLAQSFSRANEGSDRRDNYIEVSDGATGRLLARLPQAARASFMQFDTSGTRLLTMSENNENPRQQLDVWDWSAGKVSAHLLHEDEISKIRFSEQATVLATVSAGRVYVWDYSTGELLSQLADAGYVRDLRFSRDGRYLLTGGADGSAALWLWKTEDLQAEACKRLTRNLSLAEWQQYLGARSYRATCEMRIAR